MCVRLLSVNDAIETVASSSYHHDDVSKAIDPIPEVVELIQLGLNTAQDEDLLLLLSRLSVQVNETQNSDRIRWLGLYRNALKLADLIRPIQTKEVASPRTISDQERLELQAELTKMQQSLDGHFQFAQRRLKPRMHDVVTQGIIGDFEKSSLAYTVENGNGHLVTTNEDTLKFQQKFAARMTSFSDHYIDQLEIGVAEIYRSGMTAFRQVVSHERVKRPRILRCQRPTYEYKISPSEFHISITGEANGWRPFHRKSSSVDSLFAQALVDGYSNSLQKQQLQHARVLQSAIDEFIERSQASFQLWAERIRNQISELCHQQEQKFRPRTIGMELEQTIIPAIVRRIELLAVARQNQDSRRAG